MDNAFIYVRISTEDQSNWSKAGQEDQCREYCQSKNWAVVSVFEDESSGSNFDRPGWKAMVRQIKALNARYIVVAKYDRLSRDVVGSLSEIERIETKHKLRIVSASEEIVSNVHDPVFFKMRASRFLDAHYELLVIRNRTSKGRHDAAKQGRYCGPAPFGYDNARDERNKPILVVNPKEAEIIRFMFTTFANTEISISELRDQCKKMGYTGKGNSAIQRHLSMSLYAGFVEVPEFADNKRKIAKGMHEAIIPETLFWAVQERLSGRGNKKYQASEDIHLRGFLRCSECGNLLSSSRSRGKMGVYYNYYFCKKGHKMEAYRVDHVHQRLEALLDDISLSESSIKILRGFAEEEMKRILDDNKQELDALKKGLREVEDRITSLEDKVLRNAFTMETYNKWMPTLQTEKANITQRIEVLSGENDELWRDFYEGIQILGNLKEIYKISDVHIKHHILFAIFGNHLTATKTGFQTRYVSPFFEDKVLKSNKIRYIKEAGVSVENDTTPESTPYGRSSELLEQVERKNRLFVLIKANKKTVA